VLADFQDLSYQSSFNVTSGIDACSRLDIAIYFFAAFVFCQVGCLLARRTGAEYHSRSLGTAVCVSVSCLRRCRGGSTCCLLPVPADVVLCCRIAPRSLEITRVTVTITVVQIGRGVEVNMIIVKPLINNLRGQKQ
jgi:hypothetical protein